MSTSTNSSPQPDPPPPIMSWRGWYTLLVLGLGACFYFLVWLTKCYSA